MDPGLVSLEVAKSAYPQKGAITSTTLHLQDKAGLTVEEERAEEQAEADAVRSRGWRYGSATCTVSHSNALEHVYLARTARYLNITPLWC